MNAVIRNTAFGAWTSKRTVVGERGPRPAAGRMLSRTVLRLAILVAVIGWPAFFARLSRAEAARDSIWFMLHQIYYLPLSWLGPPLFTSDGESFSVQPTGRALTVFVYVGLFYLIIRIVDRRGGFRRR